MPVPHVVALYTVQTYEEFRDDTKRVVGPQRRDANANAVSRRREGNKDGAAIGRVADTVATRSEFLDREFDPFFAVRSRI